MLRKPLVASVFVVLAMATRAAAGDYSVGIGKAVITTGDEPAVVSAAYPPNPIQKGSYQGIGLEARAVYIAKPDGSEPIVLIAVDMISLCAWDGDYVRNYTGYGIPGLSRDRILLNISHTHTAPQTCDTSVRVQNDNDVVIEGAKRGGEWRDWVLGKIIAAVKSAYTARVPATLRFYRSKFDEGMNRRFFDGTRNPAPGTAAMTDLAGTTLVDHTGYDQTLDVVTVTDDANVTTGVLFFYGMHPTTLYIFPIKESASEPDLYYLHPDYPGFARKTIEARLTGSKAVFFQAMGGNVNPRRYTPGYAAAKNTGTDLGNRVIEMITTTTKLYPNVEFPNPQDPAHPTDHLVLSAGTAITAFSRAWAAPLQTAASLGRLGGSAGEPVGTEKEAAGIGNEAVQHSSWWLWARHYCATPTGHGGGNDRCELRTKPNLTPAVPIDVDLSMDIELQTFTIGQWRIAGLSHEPVTEYGLKLRNNWPGSGPVTVVGYINREQTYLPTSGQVNDDDRCAAAHTCDYPRLRFGGYEGFTAQVMNGLPAPWATDFTTGNKYDLDREIDAVLALAKGPTSPPLVNWARMQKTTVDATSAMDDVVFKPEAAINGDRRGVRWGVDAENGSGWHGAIRNPSPTNPEWIVVDFHAPRTLEEIDVYTVQDRLYETPTPPVGPTTRCDLYGIYDFQVQYLDATRWLDNEDDQWVTIPLGERVGPTAYGSITNNGLAWRTFKFAPLTTNKIRVLVTRARNDTPEIQAPFARIVEIEAWGKPLSRTNVAHRASGATAAASSTQTGNDPVAAINGERVGINWGGDPLTGSGWHAATQTFPQWLRVDFGQLRTIDEIDVYSLRDNFATSTAEASEDDLATLYHLVDFDVQYSTDTATPPAESSWIPVGHGSVRNNERVWRRITFEPVAARSIRVKVLSVAPPKGPGNPPFARIVEVEAWTPPDFLSGH